MRWTFGFLLPAAFFLFSGCGGGESSLQESANNGGPSVPPTTPSISDQGSMSSSGSTSSVTLPDQLKLWLRADIFEGVLSDGAAVSSWTDGSGAGNTATQTTAAYQPKFRTNKANGRGAIEFDGVDDHFDTTLSYTAQTVFVVYQISATLQSSSQLAQLWGSYGDGVHIAADPRSGSAGGWSFDGVPASGNKGHHAMNGGVFPSTHAVFALTPAWSYGWTQVVAAEFEAVRTLNRQVLGTLVPNFAVGVHQLGGYIFEVIVFGDTLTNAERSPIEGYLRTKYNLY